MAGKPAAGQPGWSAADFAALGAFMESFSKDLAESGELVDTRGLTAPAHARRIRLQERGPGRDRRPVSESQEVLAGYWIVECDSFDRATEIAARLARSPARSMSAPRASCTCGRSQNPRTSWNSDRASVRHRGRGPAARAGAAGARRGGAAVRRFRRRRGRGAGGAARGRRAVAADGVPDNPRGWLITVASRRMTDLLRSEQARRGREETRRPAGPPDEWLAPAADVRPAADRTTRSSCCSCAAIPR